MDEPTRPLGPRTRGDDVAMLHAALLRNGATIATAELVDRRFGATTRQAVLDLQRGAGLDQTGMVEAATAAALYAAIGSTAPAYTVVGVVTWADGTPAARVSVRASDRDLRREQSLGEVATDETGAYRIPYTADQFARAEKANADLVVRVMLVDRTLYDPPIGAVVFNAPLLAVVNIALTVADPRERSEYERLYTAIVPLLDDVTLDGLRQDRDVSDVTFLAAETGFPATSVSYFGVAQKLAAARQVRAAFFYALFVEEVLVSAGLSGSAGVRFGIDLNTELEPLYFDIVMLDPDVIRRAVDAAIRDRRVAADVATELDAILATLAAQRDAAKNYRTNQRQKLLFSRVQQFLADGAHERVRSVLATDALGDLPGLLAKLDEAAAFRDAPSRDDAQAAVLTANAFANVLGHDDQIIDQITTARGIDRPEGVRDLARLDPAGWRTVLRGATANVRIAGQPIQGDLIDRHGSALARRFEARYPTTAFGAQIDRHGAGFDTHRTELLALLAAHPDFDLAHGNVEMALSPRSAATAPPAAPALTMSEAAKQAIKSTQRVFKVAPTYTQTKALADRGIGSAAQIHTMGQTRFVADAVDSGAFTPEQARTTYAKAVDVHIASGMLAGQLVSAAAAKNIAALGDAEAMSPQIEAVTTDFPNLGSLFQLGDTCYCEDCRNVHSAAAYLVDVLQFIKQRLVYDSTVPGPAVKKAKDVLFERRPDLGDLDLSCPNTNTELPYIDMVCELLEEAVSPDPGAAFAGPLTAGVNPVEVPTPALLAALQAQAWAFTDATLVYEPDLHGARVARDVAAVAKISPDGPDWRIRLLHQTYGSAEDLLAAPAYVNDAAYAVLASSNYAFTLPFDLAHQETRSYFTAFDVECTDLMRALQAAAVPSDVAIAADALDLTDAARALVVTVDPGGQAVIWNTAPLAALGGIAQVDNFLSRAGLDYTALEELLDLAWLNPGDTMYIKHLDSGCDLSHKTIENLDDAALDRLHRFLRLLRSTGMVAAGWTPRLLDRAIRAPGLGNGVLDDAFVVLAAGLDDVGSRLRLHLDDVVNLYDPLPIGPFDTRYPKLFVNAAANGPIDDAFRPDSVTANEIAEANVPGSGVTLASHQDYLATCLGITGTDAALLVADLGPGAIISFANVTTVYADTLLMRALHLSATNLLVMRDLTAIDPLASPAATLDFATHAGGVAGAGVNPTDLRYLLRHEADDLITRDLPDATLTALLTTLQSGYQAAYAATRPAVDPAVPPEENKPGLRALLSTVPGMSAADLTAFDGLVDGVWIDVTQTAQQFVDAKLAALVDTTAIKATIVANPTEPQQTATILAISDALSAYFYTVAKHDLATATVAATYTLSAAAAEVLLSIGQLHEPPASGLLIDILTDDALVDTVNTPPVPPPVTPAMFDLQYRALRLLHVTSLLVTELHIGDDHLGWLIANAPALGWLAPDMLPYQAGTTPATLAAWENLAAGLALATAYPPVANPLDAATPWTTYGLFDLVLAATATAGDVLAYLAALAGLDVDVLGALDTHLGLSTVDLSAYRLPSTITRLVGAATLLRTLGLDLTAALPLTAPTTTAAGAATMRQALKARYADTEWPGVLRTIYDRVRLGKRDALVAYLLATNPTMRSANDLYDYFLIDVEMSPCMPTSRIVQAHATVQLFVQRCLMGLEPTCIAATVDDPAWDQWKWMANFRVAEANIKIFLWPENWILPELRTDKSELFADLDNQLQQDELTDLAVEAATTAYLEKLDDIAHLEVMACYYQTDIHAMHVLARTKGGDPAVYYYRQFQQERLWTPWARVPLDIAGDHLLAFDRNSRLTLAWPVFTLETETTKTSAIPDPDNLDGTQETDKPQQRWRIQLALSERAVDKWKPKTVSKDALFYPASGYADADALPVADDFDFFAMGMESAGQSISCLVGSALVGSFALTGCRGYPEPSQSTGYGYFQLSPTFVDTDLRAERFVELYGRNTDDLTMISVLTAKQTILDKTPGIFKITYPMQVALIDWLMFLLEIIFGPGSKDYGDYGRKVTLPLGTLMPFFYGDYARGYVIVPGFYGRDEKGAGWADPATRQQRTYADIDQFVRDVLALIAKYLQMYDQDPAHDLQKVLNALIVDPEYIRLSAEFAVYLKLHYGMDIANFYHPLVCALRTTLYASGVPALMSRTTQLTQTAFDFATTYVPEPVVVTPYPVEDIDFTSSGAYASYNWELFFHLPFDVAIRFNRDQQFEKARDWFHYIFNPVGTDQVGPTPAPQRYWITKPFFQETPADYLSQRIDSIMYAIAADPSGATIDDLKFAVSQWREKPFMPHVVAATRPVAYQLAIVVNYIKNLVDWGDQLLRQFTRESVTQATQLYILADKMCGPKAVVVPPLVSPPVETFNQLEAKVDLFGNALLDLETLIPDLNLLPHGGDELPSPLSFSSLYFCIPPNEEIGKLKDLVADRLFKIRNCQNIDGVEAVLSLFSPPIDPGALVRAAAAGLSVSAFLAGLGAPQPNYRFRVMSAKATELVGRVADLGNELLTAMEKRDAEKLARLRSTTEIALLAKIREVKLRAITEAQGTIDGLTLGRKVAQDRHDYYDSRDLMNAWEITATALSGASLLGEAAIAVGYILSGGLKLIPNFMTGGAGFGGSPTVTLTIGGDKAGAAVDSAVMTLSSIARALDKAGAMASTQAGYQRRMDDWEHLATSAQLELDQIDEQIATARLHVDMLTADLAAHDKQAANAAQLDAYLYSKFTNQELYDYAVGQVSSVYFSAYQLAFDTARKAERCYAHELGTDTTFLRPGYWDSLRKGLYAAEALHHDIKRMEVAYLDRNARERELTKHVSLASLDPAALIALRETGSCLVNVPEMIFDLDHPGHYFRRLKTVGMSIPCVAGPYTSVSAKLSLISNRYRNSTAARQGVSTAAEKYGEQPGDDRFTYNVGAIESISTSAGLNDSGMFELNFADERYLPFEGKGAIGTWRLELPGTFRQFDYDTISDVVLHLRYTARDGGSTLRTLVEGGLRELLNAMVLDATHNGLYQAYSIRRQFPDEWWQFQTQQSTQLTIDLAHLPMVARGHTPVIDGVTWYATLDTDPASYPLAVVGAPPTTLIRDAALQQCIGSSGVITLGTPFTVSGNPAGLTDLTLLVHYTLNA
jgi:hypothetical protein